MARRVRGLYRRGNVWWCCYKDHNERVVRQTTGKTDYNEAITFLFERRQEVKNGQEPGPLKIPKYYFSDLVTEYKKWAERQRSFSSKVHLINQVSEDFGQVLLRNFNSKMLEQYQTERLQRGRRQIEIDGKKEYLPNKPSTVNRLMATISAMFTKAVEWEMLSEDVLKKLRKVKGLPENNRRLRYLSQEECQALINACDAHLKPIVIAAMNTGMRRGEILKLTWDRVDLKHGFILLDITKNGERREIPINDTLRGVFQGLTRRIDIPYAFFGQGTGKPFKDLKKSFKTALRRAGIRDFHFHDLRHTFASHLVMAGVDLTTVKELLGHKTLTMTLRYAHLAPAHKAKAVDILDRAINKNNVSSQLLHSKAVNG